MFFKKAIYCVKCSYTGKALIVRSTWVEKLALIVLVGLCIALPALLVYTIPLVLADLLIPAIQLCPDCHHVEFLSREEADQISLDDEDQDSLIVG